MPVPRPALRRGAAGLVLAALLTGCGGPGEQEGTAPTSAAAPSSASPSGRQGKLTEQEACARVADTVRGAPQALREDPLELFQELAALAESAPAELSGQITAVRDSVDAFRNGEGSLTGVLGELRGLQQRCSS